MEGYAKTIHIGDHRVTVYRPGGNFVKRKKSLISFLLSLQPAYCLSTFSYKCSLKLIEGGARLITCVLTH